MTNTNTMQTEVDSLRTGIKPPASGMDVIRFPGGKTMSMAGQPHADDTTTVIAADALAALSDIHKAAQDVAGNQRLSEIGKREDLVAKAAPHIRAIANQHAAVDAMDAAANAREVEHFTPAALKPADMAGAITDGQVRSQFSGMTPNQQSAVLSKVRGGGLPVVADALQRDPFGATEPVTNAWRSGMDVRAPVVRAEIDAARLNADWARRLVKQTAVAATAASGMRHHEILAALGAGHKGAAAFGIQKSEKPQPAANTSGLESTSSNQLATDNA